MLVQKDATNIQFVVLVNRKAMLEFNIPKILPGMGLGICSHEPLGKKTFGKSHAIADVLLLFVDSNCR